MSLVKSEGVHVWQVTLSTCVRTGLYTGAEVRPFGSLFGVFGIYSNGKPSAVVAKYSDERRATDAANVVNSLARLDPGRN